MGYEYPEDNLSLETIVAAIMADPSRVLTSQGRSMLKGYLDFSDPDTRSVLFNPNNPDMNPEDRLLELLESLAAVLEVKWHLEDTHADSLTIYPTVIKRGMNLLWDEAKPAEKGVILGFDCVSFVNQEGIPVIDVSHSGPSTWGAVQRVIELMNGQNLNGQNLHGHVVAFDFKDYAHEGEIVHTMFNPKGVGDIRKLLGGESPAKAFHELMKENRVPYVVAYNIGGNPIITNAIGLANLIPGFRGRVFGQEGPLKIDSVIGES